MDIGIKQIAALHVVRICNKAERGYNSDELNDMVAAFPSPGEAARLLNIPLGSCPIMFKDIWPVDVGDALHKFIENGGGNWPIFYMPSKAIEAWSDDEGVKAVVAFLNRKGLDLQLTMGGPATWLRGQWVVLCDARLRFLEGVSHAELAYLTAALPPPR